MLSLGIFSLLIWIILSIYAGIQKSEDKIISTQKMVQVAQDFSERLFNWSLSWLCSVDSVHDNILSLQCSDWRRQIQKSWSQIYVNNSNVLTEPWYSDRWVNIQDLQFRELENNFIAMSITTNILDKKYFTWLALWTNWFTLTSSYYFGKFQ